MMMLVILCACGTCKRLTVDTGPRLRIAEGWEGAGVGTAPRAGVGTAPRAGVGTAPTGGVGAAANAGVHVGAGTGVSVDVTGGKTIAAPLLLAEPEGAGVATTPWNMC